MLRHLTAACLAALLALNVVAPRISAKPPDLPDDDPIIVGVPEPAAVPSTPILSGAYLFTIDPISDCCCEEKPEQLTKMPRIESECPHRAAKADRRVLTAAEVKDMPSVMDNLRALQKAVRMIDRARKVGMAGNVAKADEILKKARKLCPGSSCARHADKVLNEILVPVSSEGDISRIRDYTAIVGIECECRPVVSSETPKKSSECCPQLIRIQNAGACWVAHIGTYCGRVQATAEKHAGCCCKTHDIAGRPISLKFDNTPLVQVADQLTGLLGVPVKLDPIAFRMRGMPFHVPITVQLDKMPVTAALDIICRPLGLAARVRGDSICITSPVVTECGKGCPASGSSETCEGESACPKCEKLHQEVMKKKAPGVTEQVNGLMKACYFAIGEGRTAKAADLARQAHALDPERVEADPLVYKLHLIDEKGQCEECDTPCGSHPACPKGGVEDNLSLRPALPAVDPEIVPALDRVLTTRYVGKVGLERIGVNFEPKGVEQDCESKKESCCPCCEVAKRIGSACLANLFGPGSESPEKGYFVCNFSTTGISGHCVSECAGMNVIVFVTRGIPTVWVTAKPAKKAE